MQRTPRLACLEQGDAAALARLLADGGWDLRQPLVTKPDRPPLHIAAENGHLDCVRMLLEAGADPRQMTSDGLDAVGLAIIGGHTHLIRPLLEGGSLGIHEPRGQVSAAALRQMGAPDHLPEDQCQGQTLLALAAGEDRVECLKVLLELEADINQPNPGNQTRPVQAAALRGAADALAFLADRGANLAVKDKLGMSVLSYCCAHGYAVWQDLPACPPENCPHAKCLRALFSRNFCLGLLESTSGNGYTALETACLHGHVAPARVLLANGAAVGGADPATAVPLAAACAAGCPELVELLLEYGARYPSLPMKGGKTSPLQAALLEPMQSDTVPWGHGTPGHLRCAEIMLDRGLCSGAEKTTKNGMDIYNLDALISFNDIKSADAIRLLLRHGAPPNRPGGAVPLYFAARRGYTAAVEALLEHGALLQPPSRADNALVWAAAQPASCTLALHASRHLSREERRQLYSAPVPPGLPLPEAITQPPGKPTWQAVQDACGDRKCAKLLRACLQEVGMEVEMNLPPRAPKEQPSVEQQFAALSRVAQSTATEGAATGGGGSSAASGSRAARGTIASAASTSADSSRGTHTFMLSPHDGDGISRQMDAHFERRHRECPDLMYGAIFDANWRSLAPAQLQAEVRRVLQPLKASPHSGTAELQDLFIFLSNAVHSSKLRGVLMKEGLPAMLAHVLTPEAVQQHTLTWHEHAMALANTLLNVESSTFGKHGPALARYLWSLLDRCLPTPPPTNVAEGAQLDPFGFLCVVQCLTSLGGPAGVPQLLTLCPGGEDAGRMLLLRACAAAMANQDDQTPVLAVIKALKELRAFGIYDMGTPPMRCMVYRSSYARDLFTQPCLLGAALQCLKGLVLQLQQAPLAVSFLQDLMPLLACCTVEARHYGLVRLIIDGVGSPDVGLANGCINVLYLLVHYADKETVDCLARAGLLPAMEARLGQLLAGGTSAAALAAAVAAQTSHNNAVLANTLAMCVGIAGQRTQEMAGEAANCKAVAKGADLLKAIAAAFGEQPQHSIWSALCRQTSHLLVMLCDRPATAHKAVEELGLHNTLAQVLPRVHPSAVPNLLGLWAKLLRHAGDRITADMRTQGVPTARTFQGLSQPMMVVMGCLERYSAHPQLAHIAGGVLALTLRVLEGQAVDWTRIQMVGGGPHPIFGKQRFDEERCQQQQPAGGTCACCGVAASTPGVTLKKCSRCKAVAYCGAVCQARHWKHWHKAACVPA